MEFDELIEELEIEGKLIEPDGKKIVGTKLFEMRVRSSGAWRGFYAYFKNSEIIILSFFNKKTQKAPKLELNKAINRLKNY